MRIERPPRPPLARHVARLEAACSASAAPLLPDAAIELVWSGRGLFVRGADTRPFPVGSFPERTFVVATFRPGAAAGVLGLSGRALADARIGISELWGRAEMQRLESLLSAATPHEAMTILEDAVETRIREAPDRAVEAAAAALRSPRTRVGELAERLGIGERQLHRRCVAALGYGPKTLDRILRFQRFRALSLARPSLGLVELAAAAGYADQAHLTREALRLGGATPRTLVSETFKTA
ncbi:MAG: helix-turn-helix domain-containing protein [Gaiellaceae bacterium]